MTPAEMRQAKQLLQRLHRLGELERNARAIGDGVDGFDEVLEVFALARTELLVQLKTRLVSPSPAKRTETVLA